MKRIILAIISVLFSITLSYAESCSCGQGCLSYQISGCGEQSRACCTGQWCSWGTSSCASCTATSQACSGNVTNACAGNRTRSVTGSCGSTCSYSGWNDSGCSYTQSCTATSESRNCSGNVSNACAGTQTRTRTVAGTCGSCSYNSWGSWSTNNCSYTQSCTATNQACVGNVTNACAGNRTRTVTSTCGSCTYSSWNDSGCSYTVSCPAAGKVYCKDLGMAHVEANDYYYGSSRQQITRTPTSATACGSTSNCTYTYSGMCYCDAGYTWKGSAGGCRELVCYTRGPAMYDYFKFTDYQSCINLYNKLASTGGDDTCTYANYLEYGGVTINTGACGTVCGYSGGYYKPCSNYNYGYVSCSCS